MLELLLFFIIIALTAIIFLLIQKLKSLESMFSDLEFKKSSQSIKYGQLTEQWIPFSKEFPYNSQDFKFLGQPIDGIVFSENKIVFCKFKTNTSNLSEKQKR